MGLVEKTLEDMRNLGPKTSDKLRNVGINTPDQLVEVGAVEAYCRLKALYPQTTNILALTAMEGAIMDVNWQDVPAELSDALKLETWKLLRSNKKGST